MKELALAYFSWCFNNYHEENRCYLIQRDSIATPISLFINIPNRQEMQVDRIPEQKFPQRVSCYPDVGFYFFPLLMVGDFVISCLT